MTDDSGPGAPWSPDPYPGSRGSRVPGGGGADGGPPREPPGGFAVPADPPLTGYPQPGSAVPGYPQPGSVLTGYPQPGSAVPEHRAPWEQGSYPWSNDPAGAWSGQYPPDSTGGSWYGPGGDQGVTPGPYSRYDPGQSAHPPAYSPGAYPSGAYPSGAYPPAAYPPGAYPSGAHPPVAHPFGWPAPGTYYPGPASPPSRSRPGTLTAAAVLAFVTAGLDLVGCLAIAGVVIDDPGFSDPGRPWWAGYLWAAVLASLAAGALLIAGGVLALRGRVNLLSAGAIVTAVVAVFWISAAGASGQDPATADAMRFYALVYLALTVVMTALALGTASRQWRPHDGGAG